MSFAVGTIGSPVPTKYYVDEDGYHYPQVTINTDAVVELTAVGMLTSDTLLGPGVEGYFAIDEFAAVAGVTVFGPPAIKRAVISTTEPIRYTYITGANPGGTTGHTVGLNSTEVVVGVQNILNLKFARDATANAGEDAIITITLEA